jgi:hypothetical protein
LHNTIKTPIIIELNWPTLQVSPPCYIDIMHYKEIMNTYKMASGGIADFQQAVNALKGFGRYEDDTLAHVATGETIIPMEVFEKNPQLRDQVFKSMTDLGIDPTQYIVGSNFNSINPVTGQPEFFLKKLFKKIKKAAPVLLPIAASFIPGAGPLAMAAAGFGGGKIAGQDTKQALMSGILAGLGGKFAGGTQAAQAGGFGSAANPSLGSSIFKGISKEGLGSLFRGANNAALQEALANPNSEAAAKLISRSGEGSAGNTSFLEKGLNLFRKGGKPGADFSTGRVGAGLLAASMIPGMFQDDEEEEEYIDTNVYAGDFGQLANLGIPASYSPGSNIVPFKLAGGGYMGGYNGVKADAESLTASDNIDSRIMKNLQYEKMAPGMMGYAAGGIARLREGGFPYATAKKAKGGVSGPGTGTSDDIPAYLSNGEFVITAKAVKNAGGSKPMYDMMEHLEKGGKLSPASRGR